MQLAGVQAAVGAGLGIALMATFGQTPEGLVARDDLPRPAPLPLALWARQGLPAETSQRVAEALRQVLAQLPAAQRNATHLELATGA
ncbi:hypothetical protein FRAHR75_430047 [Frankia sp. Hr75.2]|nr:hypothetical protein FRAHR75_430047 [Frankia sp. Hr75.2]